MLELNKTISLRLTFNCSGFGLEDDVVFINCLVPQDTSEETFYKHLKEVDAYLREENENGDSLYMLNGYNEHTLLEEMIKRDFLIKYSVPKTLWFEVM